MTDRKKPGMVFWASLVLVMALVGYPLSVGPACRIADHWDSTIPGISVLYRPLIRITWRITGKSGLNVIFWYCMDVWRSGKIIELRFVREAGLH